jgi:uncharacterized protein YbcV (DUF1398 family)
MNADLIHEAARATHEGSRPFPEIVGLLIEAGVEFYQVDYLSLTTIFHDGEGERVVVELPYEDLPAVAVDFDLDGVRADILDSQTKGQNHQDFTRRAMLAGVQGYFAFLRGRRVTYLGRQGDQHIEWFPSAR